MRDFCLFAHFDKDDRVDDYVLRYLKHIKELNFSIVFISTARLPVADIERLRSECFDVIVRENVGLDFGSWAAGLAKHGAAIEGRLLLANDSVYGPIGSLSAAIDRLTSKPADFYGLVESIEIAPHLQSWFLLFEPGVVQHPAFRAALSHPYAAMTKWQIVTEGEVNLTRHLTGAGFRYNALYRSHEPGNPMHFLWRELVFEEGIPFLKVELLRDNPLQFDDPKTILAALEDRDRDFCAVVRRHLARVRSADTARQSSALRRLWWRLRRASIRNAYRRRHKDV